jgi:DNA-binding PadR family transcriptional regulator
VEGSRQRKYYSITEEGHRVLSRSVTEWTTFTEKLMEVLERHGYVEPESVPG